MADMRTQWRLTSNKASQSRNDPADENSGAERNLQGPDSACRQKAPPDQTLRPDESTAEPPDLPCDCL